MTKEKAKRNIAVKNTAAHHCLTMSTLCLLISLATFCGCRRTDVREMTVTMPSLKAADQAKIVEALSKYSGIQKDSYRWDMNSKTLTLRYDSMQIAQANIRYAIDEKVTKVTFPEKTDDHAGH